MKIAVITIGDEILSGFTVNTNLAFIGQSLLNIGTEISSQMTIDDSKESVIKALEYYTLNKYSHVIVTGGLGPTHDDITPSAFFKYFKSNPIFDKDYWEYLKSRFMERGITIPEKNRNQATVPDNGNILTNPIGSARGLHYNSKGTDYFALPGVPSEMKQMMENHVIPIISKNFTVDLFVKTIRTIGLGESAISEKIEYLFIKYKDSVKVAFLPQLGKVDIRLFSKNKTKLDNFVIELKTELNEMIYGYNNDTIESSVAQLLLDQKLTIATAESCTGGLLSHRLTNVSGSSYYLKGGVVCYSNESKINLVGVNNNTIEKYGAVSEETAKELAINIKEKFKTDIGIGITGIAGPGGGSDDKPVGLVYIGLAITNKVHVKRYVFVNERLANKLFSSQTALNLLRLELIK